MKIAIVGIGQLGSVISSILSRKYDIYELPHSKVDITNYNSLFESLSKIQPDYVINTAAYVDVDGCERKPDIAFSVNCIGALNLAKISDKFNIKNVYISTDFVFDGKKGSLYNETDLPNPINVYGTSKFCGELVTKLYSNKYYILRVASLFGPNPTKNKKIGNFVNFVVNKLSNNEEVNVISDIITSPTYTITVAKTIDKLISVEPDYGIYHLVNSGECTWYEFANYIADIMNYNKKLIHPVKHDFFKREAMRPQFSALNNKKIENALGTQIPTWKEAVKTFLKENYKPPK